LRGVHLSPSHDPNHHATRRDAAHLSGQGKTDNRHLGGKMRSSDADGQIAYNLVEFCNDYGNPYGRLFTFEVTCDAVTYVYADVVGTVRADKVIFELNREDLVCTRKAH
jgi:hypothetical protein